MSTPNTSETYGVNWFATGPTWLQAARQMFIPVMATMAILITLFASIAPASAKPSRASASDSGCAVMLSQSETTSLDEVRAAIGADYCWTCMVLAAAVSASP